MPRTSTVKFDDDVSGGATPVEVNGPVRTRVLQEAQTVHGETEDHTVFSYRPTTVKVSTWDVDLRDLTLAQKNALHDFFWQRANGSGNTFSYTHTDGQQYLGCRFLQDTLSWERESEELWHVSIRLRVPGEID